MKEFATTREAYDAYLKGSATLDEVSQAANRSIASHLQAAGRTWVEADTTRPANDTQSLSR